MRAAAGELRRYVRRLTAQLGEHDPVLHFARRVIADAERACDQLEAREVGSWRNREPSATPGEHYAAAMQDWREARRRDALQTEIEAAGAARAWRLVGTYMESCNCEVISPCRRVAGRAVGRPTYGACEGALSWAINHGSLGDVRLNGLAVVLAFAYDASEPRLALGLHAVSRRARRRAPASDIGGRVHRPARRAPDDPISLGVQGQPSVRHALGADRGRSPRASRMVSRRQLRQRVRRRARQPPPAGELADRRTRSNRDRAPRRPRACRRRTAGLRTPRALRVPIDLRLPRASRGMTRWP